MAAPKTGRTAKKRPEDRLGHRSQAEQEKFDTIDASDLPPIPEAPEILEPAPYWHPVAVLGWTTFCESPLSKYYEQTDYVQAWVTCELIHNSIKDGMSAGRSMQLRMYMNDLGFTEGARRAMDIAIQRKTPEDSEKVKSMERARARRASGNL
jgi:hypothetical protein